jgi:DNA-binding GntR family transcriptional regulator
MSGKSNAAPNRTLRIKHKTITASVADEIRKLIISGEIKGGEPLRQEMLADRFGCSLIPIREALLNLQGEGLVEFNPHRGAVAKEITVNEVDEIFTLRALLECDILVRAMPLLTESDFMVAEDILAQFEKLLAPGTDLYSWGKLNWAFHRALYEPARRPYAFQVIERLHINCDRYIMLQIKLDEGRSEAQAEHIEILKRVRKNDSLGATTALRKHILITGEKLVDSLSAAGFFDKN